MLYKPQNRNWSRAIQVYLIVRQVLVRQIMTYIYESERYLLLQDTAMMNIWLKKYLMFS